MALALEGLIEVGLAVVLVFIAPGYLSLLILNRFRGAKGVKNDLNNAVLSVILSAVVTASWFVLHGFADWEAAIDHAMGHWVSTTATILGIAIVVGLLVAVVFVRLFDPAVRRAHAVLYKGLSVTTHEDDVWDLFMSAYHKRPVSVETADGKVFQGNLQSFSTLDEKPAITISPVEEVVYDKEGNASATRIGESMLFRDGDIVRVWGMTIPPPAPAAAPANQAQA